MHQCPICPQSFPSASKLQRHHFIHSGQKPFTCSICGKAFSQSEHLKTHSQKTHHLSPSTDCLMDGIVVNDQQFLPSNHNDPTQEINRHDNSAYITQASTMSSPESSQTEWKKETLPPDICLTSSEIEDQPEAVPHENDGLVIQSSISTDRLLFMDPIPQDVVCSAAVDKSTRNAHNGNTCKVCLKSFSSPLQLWIHLPVHKKIQPFGSEICGQHFSKKSHSKMQSQSQEPSFYRGKITSYLLPHQCPTCPKTFCSPSKLQRHFLIHTGQKPFSCVLCGKAFRQEAHLKSHLSAANKCSLFERDLEPDPVHGSTRRKQRFCNGSQTSDLESQSSLLQHPSSQDTPANSPVEVELQCKISLSAMQDLSKSEIKSVASIKSEQSFSGSSQHQSICFETLNKSVEDSKPFRCTICNRSFRLVVNLMRHQDIHKSQEAMQSHTPVDDTRATVSQSVHTKTYINSEAILNSPEPNDLNIIVKSETWSENYDHYNDSLLQDAELTTSPDEQSITHQATSQHQRINTLHQCHACSKKFPSLSKLERHTMTHTGQRPFGCQMCGKRFRQKTHLRVHTRTHLWSKYHKQRSLYISRPPSRITGCHTRLSADSPVREMALHGRILENHSGIDLLSEKPLDPAPSLLSVWNDNNRVPPFLLSTSKKNEAVHLSTVSKVTMKKRPTAKPMQTPSNIRHECFLCFKCFPSASKLQRHEMVHTGLKPFQCLTCGKTFRQAPHLKVHESTHHNRRPSKPVHQQGKLSKLNIKSQQQLYPRINIHVPPQKNAMKRDTAHSKCAHLLSNQEQNEQLPTRSEISIPKVNSLSKIRIKNKVACDKRKAHMCRICHKNFATSYKLSRHLLTHSGMRPYNCNLCSETFTQLSHLKTHERSRKHDNRTSDYIQGEMIRTDHLQDKCHDNGPTPETFISAVFIDSKEDAARVQLNSSSYTSAGHYLVTDEGFSHCSEVTDSDWLALPEVDLLEENMESERKQRENCNQAPELYSHPSFPSDLTTEIHRLIQNQEPSTLSSSQQEMWGNIHSIEIASQPNGVMAKSDNHEVISERPVSSVAENQLQVDLPDDYWCEPLIMFECDKCTGSFETEQDLQHHKCNTRGEPKMSESALKHRCDVCFKNFVSPSKLERHYIIHTGQRPFRCDICGKTFTQSAHVRTHQRYHNDTV